MEDDKNWRGVHISQLQTSLNRPQYPKLTPGDEHTILIKIPVSCKSVPECYPSIFRKRDRWDANHVKLPCSEKNVTREQMRRWNLIRDALNTPILTSQQLECAILSYNKRYAQQWNFSSLHSFFNETLEESETLFFFESLLPNVMSLTLSLPELITAGIPLLKRGHKHSITLSQLQISCLLANAFLCTFPHRNSAKTDSEYCSYPDINFINLFQCKSRDRNKSVHEKLKCLINYFRRVTNSVPTGNVTYSRQFVHKSAQPDWSDSSKKLTKLFVSSSGTIEDDGFGLFQVDFANKFVGGGVIGTGCVQEEIRFVICPELILSRLFTQCLGENEALIVTGCERFNKYKGYGNNFEWDGDYVDETPSDEYGRKYCTVVALDALHYQKNSYDQYLPGNILRDINKAYAGFSWGIQGKEELCAVATGNWGCGVFQGNPQLKSFLQLMAAAEAGRDLAYFTFGNENLRNFMASIHQFLFENEVTVGKLYNLLIEFNAKQLFKNTELFEFFRSEAMKDTSSETDCDITRTNVHNTRTIGIPRLDVAKYSCCSTKINESFGLSKTDLPSKKVEQNKTEDSAEKGLKMKETLALANLYQSPDNVQFEVSRHEDNFHLLLNTFKESFKKSTKGTSGQMKKMVAGKIEGRSEENVKIPSSAYNNKNAEKNDIEDSVEKRLSAKEMLVLANSYQSPDTVPSKVSHHEDDFGLLLKKFKERFKRPTTGTTSPIIKEVVARKKNGQTKENDVKIPSCAYNNNEFGLNPSKKCGSFVNEDLSFRWSSKNQCELVKEVTESFFIDEYQIDSNNKIQNTSRNKSRVDESHDRETEKTSDSFLISPSTTAEKFVNLSALSREIKPLSSKKTAVKCSEHFNNNFKKRKISDYFTPKDKT